MERLPVTWRAWSKNQHIFIFERLRVGEDTLAAARRARLCSYPRVFAADRRGDWMLLKRKCGKKKKKKCVACEEDAQMGLR